MTGKIEADLFTSFLPTDDSGDWEGFSRALVDSTGDGLIAVSPAGVILFANEAAGEGFGARPGGHLKEVLPRLWLRVEEVLEDRKERIEPVVEGEGASFMARVNPLVLDRKLIGAVCSFVGSSRLEEIVLKTRPYQDLSREENAIIDSSSDGLWICDAQARVVRINPASERLNGIIAAEVVGKTMEELVEQGLFDKSVTVEVVRRKAVVNLLQQRGERKLVLTGTPVLDAEGKLFRVVVSERDITEIDNLQRELEEREAIKNQFRNQMLEMQRDQLLGHSIIAKSPCIINTFSQALKVSSVDSSVLILGESGVGKGLIADLIHGNSRRCEKPLIKINCGAIPESLIESELFGYEKGAFTGAQSSKPGYLEMAHGGTLFLDEIAELPLLSQVKLLRFLEDGRITRLGGTKSRAVDVRILAATHRNLEEMVERETFRLDLYYRLKVIPLYVPSVRERKDCILPLIKHFLDSFGEKVGVRKRLSRAAMDVLLSYRYPGNVRELINICERLVVMSETEVIGLQDLPQEIAGRTDAGKIPGTGWSQEETLQQIIDGVEKSVLQQTMETHGNQYVAASVLGVSQATIARKLKKHGLV